MKKRIITVIFAAVITLSLCSCGETVTEFFEGGTELFGSRGASIYVKLGDYKNSVIDKNSDDYKEYFDVLYLSDVSSKGLYERSDEGTVQKGDYANIDFAGTVDGASFEGGTDQNYDLLIGSGKFIAGFEDGLIGIKVGQTTTLHLKFPDNYQKSELAGKNTVFEVKVNYRKVPVSIENAYEAMGFESVEAYKNDLDKRCIENFAVRNLVNCCTYMETPDKAYFTGVVMLALYDDYCLSNIGKDVKTYLKESNQDINTFASDLVDHMAEGQLDGLDEIKTIKNAILAFYALYEKEGMSYEKSELGKTEKYERCFDEFMIIKKLATDYLYSNVKIVERTE